MVVISLNVPDMAAVGAGFSFSLCFLTNSSNSPISSGTKDIIFPEQCGLQIMFVSGFAILILARRGQGRGQGQGRGRGQGQGRGRGTFTSDILLQTELPTLTPQRHPLGRGVCHVIRVFVRIRA